MKNPPLQKISYPHAIIKKDQKKEVFKVSIYFQKITYQHTIL